MIASIYARKSTDEGDKSNDAKSVTRQIERAREYAARKGWKIAEQYIYSDDGISGAEFVKRPGLTRLLNALSSPRRPFTVVIVSEQSRIGRDTIRTLTTIQQIQDAGVSIYSYLDDREITLEQDTDEVHAFMGAWRDSSERRKASQRTRDALHRRAEMGHVTGCKVYGYDNVRDGSMVKRVKNDAEASVVRRIFTLVSEGWGFKRITDRLNSEGVSGGGWVATTLRAMVDNPLYRGVVIYGKTKIVKRVKVKVPESEWKKQEAPELRIIDEALWKAAHARIARTRQTHTGHRKADGTLHGRPESGLVSRHLLAGHLRCGTCGGGMFVASRVRPNGKVFLAYLCTNHHKTGAKQCGNRYAVPYEAVTSAVLSHFKPESLRAAVNAALMAQLYREPLDPSPEDQRVTIEAEVRKLDQEIGNLVHLAATTGNIPTVAARLKDAQAQRDAKQAELESLAGSTLDFDITDEEAAEEWQQMQLEAAEDALAPLDGTDPATARQVLRELLVEPVRITPVVDERGRATAWDYVGLATLDRVIAGSLSTSGVRSNGKNVTNYSQSPWATGG